MILACTSTVVAYFSGLGGPDVDAFERGINEEKLSIPPVVVLELLSDPGLDRTAITNLKRIPLAAISERFWERAGILRSKLLAKGHKAKVADAIIAQCSLDHDAILATRD